MDSEGPPPPTARTLSPALVWTALLVALVVGVYYVGVKGPKRSAFVRWRPQIQAMMQGVDAYTEFGFPTPPVMAIVLYPFVELELPILADRKTEVGMAVWLFLKVAMTLIALHWLLLQQWQAWKVRPPNYVAVLALLASATPIIADLMHGNINLWILFLVVAAWRAFGTGRLWLAGFILSLAVACKVTPALLILYFFWKREWKTTTAAVVGLAFWLFVFPVYWVGWERNLYLLDRWSGLMLRPYLAESRAERDVRNQSLAGLFQRLTSPPKMEIPSNSGPEEPLRVDPPVNVTNLSPAAARWTWRGIVGAFMVGLWGLTRRSTAATDRRWLEHEFALVLLAMLLLSERSWKHHYVTILPSFVALFSWIAHRPDAGFARTIVIALSATAAGLIVLTSQDFLGTIAGDHAVEMIQACGAYTVSAILLVACHIIVRCDESRKMNADD
jgi:alpha-1,2-mannosyltransferase